MYPARMLRDVRIAPSILSADLGHLAREIEDVQAGGADWIHVDVVDGHFAPHLTFGPPVVRAARGATQLPVDVHLMVNHPDRYVEAFAKAGADHLTIHAEASCDVPATLDAIRQQGKRAGVALRPETPADVLEGMIERLDLILVLSVNPGRAGQAFIESQLGKIEIVRRLIDRSGRSVDLVVDGGVGANNAGRIAHAGANVLVAGSKIFGAQARDRAIDQLRSAAARP